MKKTQQQTFEYELRRDMTGVFDVELVIGEKKSRFHDTKRIFYANFANQQTQSLTPKVAFETRIMQQKD